MQRCQLAGNVIVKVDVDADKDRRRQEFVYLNFNVLDFWREVLYFPVFSAQMVGLALFFFAEDGADLLETATGNPTGNIPEIFGEIPCGVIPLKVREQLQETR